MIDKEGQNKIYEELRGYFPPEYDLTPEELELEIEAENKKREIALGMMRTKFSQTTEFKRLSQTATNIDIKGSRRPLPDFGAVSEISVSKEDIPPAEVAFPDGDEPITEPTQTNEEIAEVIASSLPEEVPSVETDACLDAPLITESLDEQIYDSLNSQEEEEEEKEKEATIAEEEDSDLPFKELFEEMENPSSEDTDEDYNEGARKAVSWLFDFLEVFTICITAIIIVFAFFARLTEVSGQSMEDTLLDGERLVVSDFMYEPEIGDIVVIQDTSQPVGSVLRDPLVKRVIALGGQTVDISSSGTVTVTKADGSSVTLDETYVKQEFYNDLPYHCVVPEGHVFVLGDNRNHSSDSRSSLGTVDERCIFGKAVARILPISEFEIFENPFDN